jgi:hypothetical protein
LLILFIKCYKELSVVSFLTVFPLVMLTLSFMFIFIALWFLLSAYMFVTGLIGFIPAVISRKQRGSGAIIASSVVQMVSGIELFISCILLFVKAFSTSSQIESTPEVITVDYELIINVIILSILTACALSLAGAILSIVRTVKSRKGRIAPAKLTLAAELTSIPAALVFVVFSTLVLFAVLFI